MTACQTPTGTTLLLCGRTSISVQLLPPMTTYAHRVCSSSPTSAIYLPAKVPLLLVALTRCASWTSRDNAVFLLQRRLLRCYKPKSAGQLQAYKRGWPSQAGALQ